MEIRLIKVNGYGWLAIALEDGKEVYRGEYQVNYNVCLFKFERWLETNK